ncbi:FISUMP domain-containing protein [Fibrobacter sp. UWB5]|uniref:FISUMP domain-containing protein n=1 Tax=Fibrobacter sp. UWB5 TaxID=1964360 RepID=UPI000B51F7F4|nr:FISUMP domain-containing protein [Fibrobacter sp. UWB5]OWV10329.1 hypothetical protein B7989_12010 [Fibrobacter sp. UWB5]
MKIFKSVLVLSVLLTMLVACGDDSSSSVSPEPAGDYSSSSGNLQSSSSKGSKNSSSSVEKQKSSSSSVSGKNSSSSVVESSSSVYLFCNEGDRDTVVKEWGIKYYRCENNDWIVDTIVYVDLPKVYPNMDSLFATEYDPIYSEFEDPRDHQVYRTTILIDRNGSDKTIEVFAQNLNYGVMIDTSVLVRDDNKVEKYCDLNDEWFCNNGWGGKYAWSEAMGLPAKYDSVLWKDTVGGYTRIHQGICPDGWHIMNGYEWKNFASSAGQDLVSKANWELNNRYVNSSGMSVLFTMRAYELNWGQANFLLPNESSSIGTYVVTIVENYVWLGNNDHLGKHIPYSVRCVKDY